jgi:hypothetical protein
MAVLREFSILVRETIKMRPHNFLQLCSRDNLGVTILYVLELRSEYIEPGFRGECHGLTPGVQETYLSYSLSFREYVGL